MKKFALFAFVACCPTLCIAGPVDRFRATDLLTFSYGDNTPFYGNADANIHIEMQVDIIGQQIVDTPGGGEEVAVPKQPGTLDFNLKLSDINPIFPPDPFRLNGADLGNDRMRHTINDLLPGPVHIEGTFDGVYMNITMTNITVTGVVESLVTQITPFQNPVLNRMCDIQYDDENLGAGNRMDIDPAQVSGYVISPIFAVRSMAIDVTGIQQAGQVPMQTVETVIPNAFTVQLGRLASGNVSSLAGDDLDALRICKFIVPNTVVAPITVVVDGTSTVSTPTAFSLRVKSKMSVSGLFSQTLDLFDFQANAFSATDVRTDPINLGYSTRDLVGTGSLSRYVSSGNVRARYRIRQTGPAGSSTWCSDTDLVNWIVQG